MVYGGTWTLTMFDKKRLEAMEMRTHSRTQLRISSTERKSNIDILQIIGERRILIVNMRPRSKKFMEHLIRHNPFIINQHNGCIQHTPV